MRKQGITKYGYVGRVGGSGRGVVKLSFYRSNPGGRTTVPVADRIPHVYIHKPPTCSTEISILEYKIKHCSKVQHSEREGYKLKHLMDMITKVSTTAEKSQMTDCTTTENITHGRVLHLYLSNVLRYCT